MENVLVKTRNLSKSTFAAKKPIKLQKIALGTGRDLAEIDFDEVFGNKKEK
jgi:hypothetical protein